MNLVIFTPVIKTSAIGRVACLLVHELVLQGHKVTIVRSENENQFEAEIRDFIAMVIPWNDTAQVTYIAQKADACIYLVGNNYLFHEGCIHWLPQLPGIVCLHDFYLASLFHTWGQSRRAFADSILRGWYGDAIAGKFFSFIGGEALIAGTQNASPMTEWVCSMAQAVITHSNWGCDRVMRSCPGPVRVVPLAYDAPVALKIKDNEKRQPGKKFQLLTLGNVNLNKRVESILEAIGNSVILREQIVYRLVGLIPPDTKNRLSSLAILHGVNLVISGEVDDAELPDAIVRSDAVCCLRWPSLEAASASAIEALLYGKPTIVTDTGFYSEIPDACVFKISPQNEIEDLQNVLERLLADEALGATVALQGRQWALKTFRADNYARELTEVVGETLKTAHVLKAVDYFSTVLQRWTANGNPVSSEAIVNPLNIFTCDV